MPSSPGSEPDPEAAARAPDTPDAPNAPDAPDAPEPSVDDLRVEIERLEDRHLRALADLENLRKRAARETERRVAESREALMREWLLALDSLERALRMEPPDGPARSGLQAVLEQMEAILERHGVKRIGEIGDAFDPERHEAVGVHQTADAPDRSVVDVARSGFVLGDRVLRPAEVVVARHPEHAT